MGHIPSIKVLQQEGGGFSPRLRQRVRTRAAARSMPSIDLLVRLVVMFLVRVAGEDTDTGIDCCSGEYAFVDCSSGVEHLGKKYYCRPVDTAELKACASCLPPTESSVQCSSCCGTTVADCDLQWSWGAVLATLSLSAMFAVCSGVLALAESRRKRKVEKELLRFDARPSLTPVKLRATVVDLSDAVRGRTFSRNAIRLSREGLSDEEDLENSRLLEDFPNDSVYGALMGRGDANIPVAKLADDNWVTATVACREARSANAPPVPVGSGRSEGEDRQATPDSPPVSLLRWRSARAIARQARRMASEATTRLHRSTGTRSTSGRPEGREDAPLIHSQDPARGPSEVPS